MSKSRTFGSQYRAVSAVTKQIARLVEEGHGIVITHGNGPQVGDALLRHESAKRFVPPLPLFACVAETQGLLGFMIQTSLLNHLNKIAGKRIEVASLISKVTVSAKDPAFKNPTKPIGPTYSKKELDKITCVNPITVKEIAPNRYRRVVPSPDPISVVEADAVKELVEKQYVVIACGGGGIPVIIDKNRKDKIRFVDAVIDKDLTSALLAASIKASKFISLTNVDGVYLGYGSKKRKLLRKVSVAEMKTFLKMDEFEEGSMAPKVSAAIRFAENTGNKAIIANLNKIREALKENSGTVVFK